MAIRLGTGILKWHLIFLLLRGGIHIIDLQKTVQMARVAYENLREFTRQGEQVLFVGTKKQAQDSIQKTAERCGMPYINQRWPGGLITNWATVKKSTARMKRLEVMEQENSFEKETRTKKEALGFRRELDKLRRNFGGIKDMQNLPENLFVIDPGKEMIAIREARKMGIRVFAVVDSNCSPEWIDFPIPGNDDAIRAVSLFLQTMGDAVLEGTKGIVSDAEFRDDDASMEDESLTAESRYRGEYDESGEFILDESLAKEESPSVGKGTSPESKSSEAESSEPESSEPESSESKSSEREVEPSASNDTPPNDSHRASKESSEREVEPSASNDTPPNDSHRASKESSEREVEPSASNDTPPNDSHRASKEHASKEHASKEETQPLKEQEQTIKGDKATEEE